MDDCKSWMIEATKSIARTWVEMQQSSSVTNVTADSSKTTASANNASVAIPKGTKDELEGRLVNHTLKLCEYLESELHKQQTSSSTNNIGSKRRVNTPRVADMGVLGIRWQHSHERGSGGAGGVGNSGRGIGGRGGRGRGPQQLRKGRTPGQILLLLTAKKFGNVLGGDVAAGNAFHKELKAVIGKEDALRRKQRRDESTSARLKQMNRKPWLQKRVQL